MNQHIAYFLFFITEVLKKTAGIHPSHFSQATIAACCGLTQAQVSKYLRGETKLPAEVFIRLCAHLGQDVGAVAKFASRMHTTGLDPRKALMVVQESHPHPQIARYADGYRAAHFGGAA